MAEPSLISVDWGTSSFRAYLVGASGEVRERAEGPWGILNTPDNAFEDVLESVLSTWLERYPNLPTLASGMITSRQGWIETPYLTTPCNLSDLARSLISHTTASGRTIHFVAGLRHHDAEGTADVMRGEETQILGCFPESGETALLILPGTHSKWVRLENRALTRFATYMTGEVFAALRDHTILGRLMVTGPFRREGFLRGLTAGMAGEGALLHRLFASRTLTLFHQLEKEAAADYLSGLLIGEELREGRANFMKTRESVLLVGNSDLVDRYATALDFMEVDWRRAPSDVVAQGHYRIAGAASLLA
jgi:2-dehydro-3-deoxygalactonokinase